MLAGQHRLTGGKYGTGSRMPIKVTRALLTAALDGSLRNVEFRTDKYFGFAVPTALPGVPSENPRSVNTWQTRPSSTRRRARCRHVPEDFAKFEARSTPTSARCADLKLAAE